METWPTVEYTPPSWVKFVQYRTHYLMDCQGARDKENHKGIYTLGLTPCLGIQPWVYL